VTSDFTGFSSLKTDRRGYVARCARATLVRLDESP